MIERPSPNFGPRPEGGTIDMLVIHYTGMRSTEEALARMCDAESKVSAHYLVAEDGATYRLVPEERRAWHAGESFWAGLRNINDVSVGVELANPGHEFGYRPYPKPQMAALIELARELVARHAIPPQRVLGHSDVAPGRKRDPGELFDWQGLARAGIGLWPEAPPAPDDRDVIYQAGAEDPGIADIQRRLGAFGYEVGVTGALDRATQKALAAFQLHFRPRCRDGAIDKETARRLAALGRLLA